ncbi:MAG: hypothetical protein IT215_08090 [Chitinophagaceae bacterium]|nr:hypothetical protein [Chitinophagaceae bacterium]
MKNKTLLVLFSIVFFSACRTKQYVSKTPISQTAADTTIVFKIPVDTFSQHKTISSTSYIINPETYYTDAFYELKDMLEGKKELSFKRAVFITENAYFENQLDYNSYCKYILRLADICKRWKNINRLKNYKYIDSNAVSTNGAIFHVMSDTLYDKNKNIIKLPFTYDFNDCFAKNHWENMFVSKLIVTNKGNCHSLPFLYKILAEEFKVPAYLSIVPNHIYIRNRCKKTGWYNTEMTNAMFPTEAWVMTSGYVSVNSIVSGIYMDTLSLKQSVVVCVNDLAKGYQRKFKNADLQFILNCCKLGLEYYPNYAELLLLKAETHKKIYENYIAKYGLNVQQSELYGEKIKNHLSEMDKTYDLLARLDYREIPEEMFLEWIKSLENNKEKYQDKKISDTFNYEKKQP